MKSYIRYGGVIVTLAIILTACEGKMSSEPEDFQATLITVFPENGFAAGTIDETIQVTVEFSHPHSNLEVKDVIKNIIDIFTTEYTIIAGFTDKSTSGNFNHDGITVFYDIKKAGTHTLIFFYKIQGSEKRQFLGDYQFSINQ